MSNGLEELQHVPGLREDPVGFGLKYFVQVLQVPGVQFEPREPDQVMKITQTAAAVLQVRLQHRGRGSVFFVPEQLIPLAVFDILLLMVFDALLKDAFLQFQIKLTIARDAARLDQGGLGQHVTVGQLYTFIQCADGVSHAQMQVIKRIEKLLIGQLHERMGPLRLTTQFAVMQKHQIDIRAGIELTAAVTAQRDQSHHRYLLLAVCLLIKTTDALADLYQHPVQHTCLGATDFQPGSSLIMKRLEPLPPVFHIAPVAGYLVMRTAPVGKR